MKKRLLSAFLALAMVLTLIPATMVTASAATVDVRSGNPQGKSYTDAQGTSHNFYEPNTSGGHTTVSVTYQAVSDPTTGKAAGNWYWTDTKSESGTTIYWAVTSGVVASVGTSGNWYASLDDLINTTTGKFISTSFTLLSANNLPSISDVKNQPTSLSVDVNGYALGGTLYDAVTNLTVTDKLHPLTTTGSIPALTRDTQTRTSPTPTGVVYANLTATISNVTVPSVGLTGGANSVTLNNVAVTGGISMDGETNTTTNGKVATVHSAQRLTINNNGTNNLSTSTSVGGNITVKGDSSALILNNVQGSGKAVSVTGNSGSITVNGETDLADITVASRNGASAVPPSVTITGGKVGDITRTANDSTQANVVSVGSAGETGDISTTNGRVTVTQAETGDITVGSGSLSLAGPLTAGDIAVAGTGKTTLSITGTGSTIGTVSTTTGGNLTISSWPASRLNTFEGLSLTGYRARGVKGGTFGADFGAVTAANEHLWFDTDLKYVLEKSNTAYALYGKNEVATAISDVGSSSFGGQTPTAQMHVLCQDGDKTLYLINSGLTWATIGYDVPTSMILPTMVNSYTISTWTSGDNTASVTAGKDEVIPLPANNGTEFKLYANGVATTVVKSITKAAVSPNTPVENQNVRVTMNGTNIQISGAVTPPPGDNVATILLDLTTDALQTTADGETAGGGSESTGYITLSGVQVFYNVDTKVVQFSSLQKLPGGAIVNEKGELVLNNGTGTHYTVSASLAQPASNLDIYMDGNEIQATVSGSRLLTAKDAIAAQVAGTGAKFEINDNRAILEAINAIQATVTSDNTVTNWVTTAQNYVWRNGNGYKNASGQPLTVGKGDGTILPHSGNLSTTGNFGTDGTTITTNYCQAYIVPYLVVNVTDMNSTGTMNATLTVYYRVDVSAASYDDEEYYTVQAGRPLGALTGDMATNPVKVTLATAFPYAGATQMHQDGKYVYVQDGNKAWSITHAGSGSGSLGTIVLNATPATIELTSDIVNRAPALPGATNGVGGKAYYDDLQAALDDTVPGIVTSTGSTSTETKDTITILGTYAPTECTISMTGIARKVEVISNGNRKFNKGNSSTDVQTLNGYTFTVQLLQDNVPVGTVAIGVNGSAAGTASVSATSAKAGQTVTVTVQPVAGRTATGVTITTNTGATVTATPTGTANQYQFVVPTGATSVTVTPVFNAVALQATVAVNNPSTGSAITSAATTENKVAPGSVVTVTTYPGANQRTMGLNVQTNGSGTTAVRTGVNSFQFTVPSNVTNVVVTPSFDANNNTVFSDVWSSEYYSKSVAWAVGRGITDGTSTYTFSPGNYTTRAQMMTFLWRAAGKPIVTNVSNPFVDVYPGMGSDYYNAILWAVSKGITEGTTRTTFSPSQAVTRAQAVTFLYRYENQPAASTYTGFVDAPSSEYYAKAVSWANSKGITKGKTSTTFAPNDGVTRAQAVTFLYRDITGDIA